MFLPASSTDDGTRRAARDWVSARWEAAGFRVTVAEGAGAWSKGAAVNPTVAASDAELVIVADADSWVTLEATEKACEQAEARGWAMPHSTVKRLSRAGTTAVYRGEVDISKARMERSPYPALPGGGILMVRRDVWDTIGGFDPRFVGWGGEDHAVGLALATLSGPVSRRRVAPLWHLWHQPSPNNRRPSPESRRLDERYRKARNNPQAMRELVKEVRGGVADVPSA